MGDTVTNTKDSKGNNIVIANQEINPHVLENLSYANNKPGADVLHEVTEAFLRLKNITKIWYFCCAKWFYL